jgi:hypothetical protein
VERVGAVVGEEWSRGSGASATSSTVSTTTGSSATGDIVVVAAASPTGCRVHGVHPPRQLLLPVRFGMHLHDTISSHPRDPRHCSLGRCHARLRRDATDDLREGRYARGAGISTHARCATAVAARTGAGATYDGRRGR